MLLKLSYKCIRRLHTPSEALSPNRSRCRRGSLQFLRACTALSDTDLSCFPAGPPQHLSKDRSKLQAIIPPISIKERLHLRLVINRVLNFRNNFIGIIVRPSPPSTLVAIPLTRRYFKKFWHLTEQVQSTVRTIITQ